MVHIGYSYGESSIYNNNDNNSKNDDGNRNKTD